MKSTTAELFTLSVLSGFVIHFRAVLVAQGRMAVHTFMHLYAFTATKNKVLSLEPSLVTTQLINNSKFAADITSS